MMKEMQDMALDFHSETYQKRYTLAKLAYEAQNVVIRKMNSKARKNEGLLVISGRNERARERGFGLNQPLGDDFLAGPGQQDDFNGTSGIGGFSRPHTHTHNVLDNPLDTLPDPDQPQLNRGADNSFFPVLEENPMNHDHIDDLDALWGENGNQNEAIKSDFDNFSLKFFLTSL